MNNDDDLAGFFANLAASVNADAAAVMAEEARVDGREADAIAYIELAYMLSDIQAKRTSGFFQGVRATQRANMA